MAQVNITSEKYLILQIDGKIAYFHKEANETTTYCDTCWTVEEFTAEQDWLDRLEELNVTIE